MCNINFLIKTTSTQLYSAGKNVKAKQKTSLFLKLRIGTLCKFNILQKMVVRLIMYKNITKL